MAALKSCRTPSSPPTIAPEHNATGTPAGGLAGTASPLYDFRGSYWVNGDLPEEEDWFGGTRMTREEMTDGAFLALLNQNKDDGMTWTRSESGLPYFGEHVEAEGVD